MLDKMNELYQQMLEKYDGGLSNTSTKKFDEIVSAIAQLLDIPEAEVYATGSGSRPGNLEVRLSQGVRATTHTTVGLGFIIDEKNSPDNVEKLTNSALVTCKKFLGRGKAHYDNIVIFVESNGILYASGIICQKRTSITDKLIDELQISNVQVVVPTSTETEAPAILFPIQTIFYGAPGTGKSFKTNEIAKKYSTIRTTFHPDSDYSTFVGAYKPTSTKDNRYVMDGSNPVAMKYPDNDEQESRRGTFIKDSKIEYRFVKQAFLKAYIKAWKYFAMADKEDEVNPQFLVIEEINRGNCAQIFGDLFQLLDRKEGFSEYPIEADEDIRKSLLSEDTETDPSFGEKGLQFTDAQKDIINAIFNKDEDTPFRNVADDIACGKVLVLPPNFYIWATMNTSDQSLFPIDSAFKRRWDWKYVRICEGKKKDGSPLNYRIRFTIPEIDGKPAETVDEKWWDFVRAINKQIEEATKSEDKKLGFFFCKPDKKAAEADDCNTIISAETFVGKVVFYLWQDVFKDYGFKSDIFKKGDKKISFHDFYPEDMVADEKTNPEGIDLALVKTFVYKVLDKKENNTSEAPAEA